MYKTFYGMVRHGIEPCSKYPGMVRKGYYQHCIYLPVYNIFVLLVLIPEFQPVYPAETKPSKFSFKETHTHTQDLYMNGYTKWIIIWITAERSLGASTTGIIAVLVLNAFFRERTCNKQRETSVRREAGIPFLSC